MKSARTVKTLSIHEPKELGNEILFRKILLNLLSYQNGIKAVVLIL
jgi:hypothetical protein